LLGPPVDISWQINLISMFGKGFGVKQKHCIWINVKTIMYYHQKPEESKDSVMFQGVFVLE
jgi:hypothetical protein